MEQTNTKTELQEQQTATELRPWVTPSFERVPLSEALDGPGGPNFDATGYYTS
jgi:hypothetical protein